MKKCVIIGAAQIQNYERLKTYFSPDDYYIFCDGGLAHQKALGVSPDLIIGDFDSWKDPVEPESHSPETGHVDNPAEALVSEKKIAACQLQSNPQSQFPACAPVIRLPCEKDDTDLFYAAKYALQQGFTDFLITGAIGQRFDHSLCNISVLLYLFQNGKNAVLVDDYSEMQIIGDCQALTQERGTVPDTFSFFSLMCVSGPAGGVTIKNAKYPLENAAITPEWQYAISNQVLPGKTAEITVQKGQLLLIKVF